MLKNIERQLQLPVIVILFRLFKLEQLLDNVFCQEGAAQYSHDFIDAPVNLQLSRKNCNGAICDDCYINLYPNSIFSISPERLDTQMSLHPFKEGFHSPSVFIKERNILGLVIKVVGVVSEGSFEFRLVIDNPSDFRRVVLCVPACGEPNGLISEDIIGTLQKVFSVHYLKFRSSLFTNNKEGIEKLNAIEPFQIPIATVKNIASEWLVVNPVHGIHIMYSCFCALKRYRYLAYNIKLRVYLDARFGASEPCPLKKRQTEVNSGGIKGIILPVEFKLLVDTFLLSKVHHIIGKFFKDMIITKLISFGKHASVYWGLPKSKMEGLIGMCSSNIRQFAKAVAAIQLTEHENEHLVPVCQIPSLGSIVTYCHNEPFEVSFGKKIGNLTENIFAVVHCTLLFELPPKVICSKVRQGFWQNTY
jgi:hypothetical protein